MLPLPSHAQPDYGAGPPPATLEDDPVYRRHPEDWRDVPHPVRDAARFVRGLRPDVAWLRLPVRARRTDQRRHAAPSRYTRRVHGDSRRQRAARVAWAILFAARWRRCPCSTAQTSGPSAPAGDGSPRYGFRLTEAARASGVDFTHPARPSTRGSSHIMPQVAAMGAAVAVADFDRDGWQDFYVTNSGEGSLNRLYRNTGDGTVRGRGRGRWASPT